MRKYFIILFLIIVSQLFSKDPYTGYWEMPDGKVIIQIEKVNKEYVGYVRWLKDLTYPKGDPMEGIEQVDRKNPNSNLRNRKVINLQVVGGLKLNKQGTSLEDGWIYDSWNGKKYYGSAKVIDDNTLSLKGSIDPWGVLGYSMKVKRVQLPK
ncbi:DUF2147 domain-containing protein [uncultured Cetobacterium sp.]|uniref:DUF2147 domain-containing protein n=1 Tax=uncultured Cetobacterium sp. TaxID=527638 RepID=UPI00262BB7E4|nr:DUF2147 domain-containing protein [uncultured Cetobacterium sp.]